MNLEIITHHAGSSSRYPPVVFVHGGFHAAWCWDEYFLPHFCAHGFDVHALSLRGHGKSDGREELDSWGLVDYCADVAQVCQGLPECPVLVGHSIGAVIVQQYVQTHLARALVMISPTPLASMPLQKLWWSMRHPLTTAQMVIRQDINQSLPALRHLFFSSDTPKEQIDRYMAQMQTESNRVFKDIARISDPNPRKVQLPVLILAAEQDRIPKRVNEWLAKSFSAELETLPVAHDVMLTPKWKLAADRVIDWIAATCRTTAS